MAGNVCKLAQANGLDVPAAAQELNVQCTAHAIVLQRAAASCERLDCALDEAQDGGRLKFFNQVYRRKRIERASPDTRHDLSDRARKLQRVLAQHAAGQIITPGIVTRVFGEWFSTASPGPTPSPARMGGLLE